MNVMRSIVVPAGVVAGSAAVGLALGAAGHRSEHVDWSPDMVGAVGVFATAGAMTGALAGAFLKGAPVVGALAGAAFMGATAFADIQFSGR